MGIERSESRRGSQAVKAERQERVWALRLAGASFRQIAKEVGISRSYTFDLYRDELTERKGRIDSLADEYVAQQLERLDAIILSHWSQRSLPRHAEVIMRAMDAQAKLLGLNITRVKHEGEVDIVHEDAAERRRRILEETADAIALMTPEELAAEAAGLSTGD
jgi:AcrR family transcriptional regulator